MLLQNGQVHTPTPLFKKQTPTSGEDAYVKKVVDYSGLYQSKFLCYFTPPYKTLIQINLELNAREIFPVQLSEGVGDRAAQCLLPRNKLFHYGGILGQKGYSSFCFRMKLDTHQVTELPKLDPGRWGSGCTYWGGSAYLFGGSSSKGVLNEVWKLDLTEKHWEKLLDLPEASANNTAVAYKDFIFVTGFSMLSLWKYYPQNNTYSEVTQVPRGFKLLFRENENLYLLNENSVLQMLPNGQWSFVSKGFQIPDFINAPPTRHGRLFYFVLYKDILCCFDTKDFAVRMVKNFQVEN